MPQINFYPALKVWYLEAGSSLEQSSKHEAEGEGAAIQWQTQELIDERESVGCEVIEVRYIRSPVDSGDVIYHNPRF